MTRFAKGVKGFVKHSVWNVWQGSETRLKYAAENIADSNQFNMKEKAQVKAWKMLSLASKNVALFSLLKFLLIII